MKSYYLEADIPTLGVALSECVNVEELKKLAALLSKEKLPTRKAELAAVIMRQLEGERLQAIWHRLDELQRAAVAEVVHSGSTRLPADRFRAKYGQDPNWGTGDEYSYRFSPSALCLFF